MRLRPTTPTSGATGATCFLQRAVYRINRFIQPDAVVVLGDLIDKPTDASDARERLQRMKDILQDLEAPYIAIPGNHDPEPELFFQIFDVPEPVVDIGPVRFVPFIDPFTDDFNAVRAEADIARLTTARNGHSGPIVALQHVPVVPPGKTNSRSSTITTRKPFSRRWTPTASRWPSAPTSIKAHHSFTTAKRRATLLRRCARSRFR